MQSPAVLLAGLCALGLGAAAASLAQAEVQAQAQVQAQANPAPTVTPPPSGATAPSARDDAAQASPPVVSLAPREDDADADADGPGLPPDLLLMPAQLPSDDEIVITQA
jgi:hypothetical protein